MLAIAILYPLIMGAFHQSYLILLGSYAMLYIIVVSGIDVLFGYSGQITIGHAGFYAIGAHGTAIIHNYLNLPPMLSILASGRLCQPGYLCTQAVGHVCDDAALWWLGLAPITIREIFESIKRINAEGTTILFVEQNARIALETAQRGYVLQTGKIELTDTCENLISNEEVQRIYLGTN